jgi:hypothetical protein
MEGVSIQRIRDRAAHWQVGAAWRQEKGSPLKAKFLGILREELSHNAGQTLRQET